MEIREIFVRCAEARSGRPVALSLVLRSGLRFRGHALGVEGETWALRIEDGTEDCLYVPEAEVSGLIVHAPEPSSSSGESETPAQTLAGLVRRAAGAGREVYFEWQGEEPSAAELATAVATLDAVLEALGELPASESAAIRSIRLLSAQGGRFRVVNGELEAGFVEGMTPPASRELVGLLALIL